MQKLTVLTIKQNKQAKTLDSAETSIKSFLKQPVGKKMIPFKWEKGKQETAKSNTWFPQN